MKAKPLFFLSRKYRDVIGTDQTAYIRRWFQVYRLRIDFIQRIFRLLCTSDERFVDRAAMLHALYQAHHETAVFIAQVENSLAQEYCIQFIPLRLPEVIEEHPFLETQFHQLRSADPILRNFIAATENGPYQEARKQNEQRARILFGKAPAEIEGLQVRLAKAFAPVQGALPEVTPKGGHNPVEILARALKSQLEYCGLLTRWEQHTVDGFLLAGTRPSDLAIFSRFTMRTLPPGTIEIAFHDKEAFQKAANILPALSLTKPVTDKPKPKAAAARKAKQP